MGFLVLTGQLIERHSIAGRQSADLLLPGDPSRPWPSGPDYIDLVAETSWSVAQTGALALLDRDFMGRAAHWPSLLGVLAARWRRRVHLLSLRLAIAQMPRLDERLHVLLWCLGDRLGIMRADGLAVPLEITDRALGELIGAQREPVSRALRSLRGSGLVHRLEGGGFLLVGAPPLGATAEPDAVAPAAC